MIPVDMVTGMLGAGKTTFITGYAAWLRDKGQRVAVVENEFALAGVDTAVLRSRGIDTVRELAGGCICCGLKVNFHDLLLELAQCGQYDRIVVEPSGVFDLDDGFDVLSSPKLREAACPGNVITLVDASAPEPQGAERELMLSQLHSTGCVVLTKAETPQQAQTARARVRALLCALDAAKGAGIPIVEAQEHTCRETAAAATPVFLPHARRVQPHTNLFFAATLYPKLAQSAQEVDSALAEVFRPACGRVLRVKGGVKRSGGGAWLVSATPGRWEVQPSDEAPCALNVIGTDLHRDKIKPLFP
ncbi:MAG: GTP-binding protein [Eubacteriales bacterium]|nr:GTP-binding protein [Eubacteriales bacterium]